MPSSYLLVTFLMMMTSMVLTQSMELPNYPENEPGAGIVVVMMNLTAMCKDGADFCEDPEDYPLDLVAKVIEKKRTRREIQRHSPRQVK